MSYKCCNCGNVFEYPDGWEESRGEFWGEPAYESMSGCPHCHGDYEEAMPCKICDSEYFGDELQGGVCSECIKKYQYDIDMCFKIGANDTDKVELNCFLASPYLETSKYLTNNLPVYCLFNSTNVGYISLHD